MWTVGPLHGTRVWLSGAVPEPDVSTVEERAAILEFVRRFSASVFQQGGHIIHGSHPSLTPTLLEQAERHQERGGNRDCLILAISRLWSKNSPDVAERSRVCSVYETPEAEGPSARDDSLRILREWMAARCDAFVAVGGKWWQQVAGRAGVPVELSLATDRGVACFLLGGIGGVAKKFVSDHPDVLLRLKNGLDLEDNRRLATEPDVGKVATEVSEQLGRLPVVRGRVSDTSSFRILALDGGGLKGTFTAAALATWERQFRTGLAEHFDLVAGTSTGGILAIGLGLGMSAEEMLHFYRERGPTIFPVTGLARRVSYALRHLFRPKYSQEVLLNELESAYHANGRPRLLRDSKCRLLIPAYHAVGGVSHVFRTPHHPLLQGDADTEAAHAALATAAAPTYFSAANVGNMIAKSTYFDGGVWANCPVMAAIVEAVCYLGISLDRIDVLSVGTTEEPGAFGAKVHAGVFRWGTALIDLLMRAQAESSLRHARLLAGEPRFLRVNAMTKPGSYSLDSPAEIDELAALGELEARNPEVLAQIRSRFLNGVKASPWRRAGTPQQAITPSEIAE
jgi:hypothetical protein